MKTRSTQHLVPWILAGVVAGADLAALAACGGPTLPTVPAVAELVGVAPPSDPVRPTAGSAHVNL